MAIALTEEQARVKAAYEAAWLGDAILDLQT
jgi:hypothetical protein